MLPSTLVVFFLRPVHILILLIVIIVIFGASKLPDVARNLGKSMKIFKQEVKELTDDSATPAVKGKEEPASEEKKDTSEAESK